MTPNVNINAPPWPLGSQRTCHLPPAPSPVLAAPPSPACQHLGDSFPCVPTPGSTRAESREVEDRRANWWWLSSWSCQLPGGVLIRCVDSTMTKTQPNHSRCVFHARLWFAALTSAVIKTQPNHSCCVSGGPLRSNPQTASCECFVTVADIKNQFSHHGGALPAGDTWKLDSQSQQLRVRG